MGAYEDRCWAAIIAKDPSATQTFVYGVRTTKIHCRPTCKARLARRCNVVFFRSSKEAVQMGYRACKRCKPELIAPIPEGDAETRVREFLLLTPIQSAASMTSEGMAQRAGVSKWHFHRVFKKVTGVTPREYFQVLEDSSSTPFGVNAVSSQDSILEAGHVDDSLESMMHWLDTDAFAGSMTRGGDMLEWPASPGLVPSAPRWSGDEDTSPPHGHDSARRRIVYATMPIDSGNILAVYLNGKIDFMAHAAGVDEISGILDQKYPRISYERSSVHDDGKRDNVHHHFERLVALLDEQHAGSFEPNLGIP